MSNNKLKMTFEANTIKHLGVKMYSNMPPALAELIANAYDACATEVHVRLFDEGEKKVVVQDNGIGMSFDEVNNYFLRIGRNRREESQESPCSRVPTGKKGLGKLALFGIGDTINITTFKKDEDGVSFDLDWNEIQHWKGSDYEPSYTILPTDNSKVGTIITLTNLKRKTGFPLEEYAENISKLFNFQGSFVVSLSLNNSDPVSIDSKTKYASIKPEFEWDIQKIISDNVNEYSEKDNIQGVIVTTEKPLKTSMRGVTLFANGRMVNNAEFYGPSESSHFYSYATGWLNVDFIDNWEEDVISTNRQSIDWEHPKTAELRKYIASCINIIERQWRESRKEKKKKVISEKTHINIRDWLNKLPDDVQSQVEDIVNLLDDTPELSEDTQQKSIEIIHNLIPEYPKYHWRHLNDSIRRITQNDYQSQDYLRAAEEAIKLYETEVCKKSEINDFGVSLMGRSFGPDQEPLKVSQNISITDKDIEKGQKHMSIGIMAGFRNPTMHTPKSFIHPAIFDDNDCLDLLSMISYLFKKFEGSRNINKRP